MSKRRADDCIASNVQKVEMNPLRPEHLKSYLDATGARGVLPMFYLDLVSGLWIVYIARHIEHVLEQINTQYPVLLATGPRQVGKTTRLEHLAQKEGRPGISDGMGGSAATLPAVLR